MAAAVPPHQVTVPVSLQRWDSLTFLHWPFSGGEVQRLLPRGLRPDLWEGRAWVGLTPFLMTAARVGTRALLPVVSRFPETNLRTYVRGPDGGDGIWFLSLDAPRLAFVLAMRATLGLPYLWADMSVRHEGDHIVYRSRRRSGFAPPASSRIVVRPGRSIPEERLGDFEHYLTGRWFAYSAAHGRLWSTPVVHRSWPLARAEVIEIHDDIMQAAALPAPMTPPVVHFSPGVVDVRVGLPRVVSSRC
jgi:hypothetical protein